MKYLLFLLFITNLYGQELPKPEEFKPATKTIPFWQKELMGDEYKGPLPFGVALNFLYMQQDMGLEELYLKVVDSPKALLVLAPLDSKVKSFSGAIRPDAWLLPFLNVYGLIGGVGGNIKVKIDKLEDTDTGKFYNLNLDLDYGGGLFGIGAILLGNVGKFFGLMDFSYSYSNLNIGDSSIKSFIFTPKIGYLITKKKSVGGGALWVGAMYWSMNYKLQGIDAHSNKPNGPEISYDLTMDSEKPWNFIIGGGWEFNPRWGLLVELGLGNRKQLDIAGKFRF